VRPSGWKLRALCWLGRSVLGSGPRYMKREICEGEKGTARLSEQALALRNWHDAMSSKPWKKRHARLNTAKKSAARTRRDGAGGGRPNAPHGGGRNHTLGMKWTSTLLHMPPALHAPRADKDGNACGAMMPRGGRERDRESAIEARTLARPPLPATASGAAARGAEQPSANG